MRSLPKCLFKVFKNSSEDDILQVELIVISTHEEIKAQFRNEFQLFQSLSNIPVNYPVLWNIEKKFSFDFLCTYLVKGFSSRLPISYQKNRPDISELGYSR